MEPKNPQEFSPCFYSLGVLYKGEETIGSGCYVLNLFKLLFLHTTFALYLLSSLSVHQRVHGL
jgi:hypothetical protein